MSVQVLHSTIKKAYDPLTLLLIEQISSLTCQEGVGAQISASRMPLRSNCGTDEDTDNDNDDDSDDEDDYYEHNNQPSGRWMTTRQ